MKEKLSALLDGELDQTEQELLFRKISSDPALRKTWERYLLMRSIMRNELGINLSMTLADRVFESIEREPAILAPQRRTASIRSLGRIAGSLAIAASVAVVSIIGLQSIGVDDGQYQQLAQTANSQLASKAGYIRAGETRWNNRQPGLESKLNMYLVEHNEFSPSASFRGMMSYGRVVSYDND